MFRNLAMTGAAMLGLLVAWTSMSATDNAEWATDEQQGPLFGDTSVRTLPSALDTSSTRARWKEAEFMTGAAPRSTTKELAAVFPLQQAQSYMEPPTAPMCSINTTQAGDPNNTEQACSTSLLPVVPFSGKPACSTIYGDINGTGAVCSANSGLDKGDLEGTPTYCSTGAGGAGNAVRCSVQGGATSPTGGTNGNAACSTGYTQPASPDLGSAQYCSTAGNLAPPSGSSDVSCSTGPNLAGTGFGQHQQCSSGMTSNYGDYAFCSADPGSTAGNNFCSVNGSSPGYPPTFGSKCSAMSIPGRVTNGTRQCSVFSHHEGDMSTDACSIRQGVLNGACTVMTMPGDNGFANGATYCSSMDYTDGLTEEPRCSTLMMDGTVLPPDATRLCGTMTGHHGPPVLQIPSEPTPPCQPFDAASNGAAKCEGATTSSFALLRKVDSVFTQRQGAEDRTKKRKPNRDDINRTSSVYGIALPSRMLEMLLAQAVKSELELDDIQWNAIHQIRGVTLRAIELGISHISLDESKSADEQWRELSFKKSRIAQKCSARMERIVLDFVLTQTQSARLKQLDLQGQGVNALAPDDVANELQLSDGQRAAIRKRLDALRQLQLGPELPTGGPGGVGGEHDLIAEEQVKQRLRDAEKAVMDVLTSDQMRHWSSMLGPTFDFHPRVK